MKPIHWLTLLLVIIGLGVTNAFLVPHASEITNQLTVDFLDIGQGDAILLTTPHRQHILIDGGPDSTILSRLGEKMPLRERTIDLMVATHNHSDHITGLNQVLPRYTVKAMWISGAIHTTNEYSKLLETIKTRSVPTEVVWKGKTADMDGVHLEVLFPLESMEGQRPEDQHDATIVVRATYGQKSFLFTGDLNEGHEQKILDSGATFQADVLKVPHHGSATGLLPAFLETIQPQYAVIQVGTKNPFGHPARKTLEKLQQAGVTTFRNDLNGTVTALTDGVVLQVKTSH